mgnify:CR=1 FL=1
MSAITGECFCRRCRFEISKPLTTCRSCHCSRCRKAFGTAASAYGEVEGGSFRWLSGEDQLSYFSSMPEWQLAFCKHCGSKLMAAHHGEPHGVMLGALNEQQGIRLDMHIFIDSKAPWDEPGGSTPQFAEFPKA